MRDNSKPKLHLDKSNLALKLLKVLRYIPQDWFYGLRNDFDVEHKNLITMIHNLKKLGAINIIESITGSKIIFLTDKGYKKTSQVFNSDYIYQPQSRIWLNKETHDIHNFIIFRFLVDYFNNNFEKVEKINTYKNKGTEIRPTSFKDFYVLPDMTIHRPDRIIFLEADTGGETSKVLFNKLLRYFYIAQHTYSLFENRPFHIYFSFVLQNREASMLNVNSSNVPNHIELGRIFKFFEKFANKAIINRTDSISIKTRDIVELLETGKVNIYAGQARGSWDKFSKVNFIEELKNRKGWI